MNVVPFDSEAEVCTLGALILSQGKCYAQVRAIVSADDFFRPANALIFRACESLAVTGSPIDLVTIKAELIDMRQLESAGGIEYVVDIVEGVPSWYTWETYSKRVRDMSTLRKIIRSAEQIKDDAYAAGADVETILGQWQAAAFEHQISTATQTIPEATLTVLQEAATKGHGLSLSIPVVDYATGGMRPGNVMILAAYTGCGKTTLALNIGGWLCGRAVPVYFVTREMGIGELVQRIMSNVGNVNSVRLRMGSANDADMNLLDGAKQTVDKWPLVVDERASTVPEIAVGVRRMALEGRKPGLVIIDYLQLLQGKGSTFRERFSNISTAIKALARETGVPFLVLSQFTRPQKGVVKHPTIFDLKESGSLENDADYVLLLHRDEDDVGQEIMASMPKNRHGPRIAWPDEGGELKFVWTKEVLRIVPARY